MTHLLLPEVWEVDIGDTSWWSVPTDEEVGRYRIWEIGIVYGHEM